MFDPRSISVITLSAALCLSADCVQAFDDATYPDLKGQWIRITPPGQPAFDPNNPRGRAQAVPLTPEYQAIYEPNVADLAVGGEGLSPRHRSLPPCIPPLTSSPTPPSLLTHP